MAVLPTVLNVTTTLPSREQALAIARAVIEARLAACAQVDAHPLTSVYRWQGTVCEEEEWRLVLKTRSSLEPALRERVTGLHPYAVPQWVCHTAQVSPDYAAWVDEVTGPSGAAS